THILRSNEFGKMRQELQDYIRELFGYKNPVLRDYGRINIVGAVTQGRDIRKLIEEGKMIGWDDPRLVTIRALRRRGIVKETFYELVREVGLSRTQTNIDFSVIAAVNRKILDPVAQRYFFIEDPIKIKIEGAPSQAVELNLNPGEKKGGRKFSTGTDFYIERVDFNSLENNILYRLMDCLNFRKEKDKFVFDSVEYEKYKGKGEKIMHWLPVGQTVEVSVIAPGDAAAEGIITTEGIAELTVKSIKEGDVVQFERFGFCRLDNRKKLEFWFAHK
ncbi:glutamate--tRNA ligase, partial [Candidatus Woesearchaeota archaeon]|nr:glutamate--tRNA ligase [Candidatus Woesearchaeota archaeon]